MHLQLLQQSSPVLEAGAADDSDEVAAVHGPEGLRADGGSAGAQSEDQVATDEFQRPGDMAFEVGST